MIQEKYCSFEQAKALKELGFPQDYDHYLEGWDYQGIDTDIFSSTNQMKYVKVPFSLVQKWLRKEKNISLEMAMFRKKLAGCNLFIIDDEGIKWIKDAGTYEGEDAYEQALSAGIDKCLEILKQNESH